MENITFLTDEEMVEKYPPPTGIGKPKSQIALEAVVEVFDALTPTTRSTANPVFMEALARLKEIINGDA